MLSYKEILKPKVIINSIIAGALVFFGAFSTGSINCTSIGFAIAGFGIAFCTQLKEELSIKSKKGAFGLFKFY